MIDHDSIGRVRLTLVALAALMLFSGSLQANPVMTDWTRVEAVQPGKRILVRLYNDSAPAGSRALTGRFTSATAAAVSLVQRDGTSSTIARERIRRVAVWHTAKRRARYAAIAGAIGAGIGSLIVAIIMGSRGGGGTTDEAAGAVPLSSGLFGGPLALVSGFVDSRTVIYNGPSKLQQP